MYRFIRSPFNLHGPSHGLGRALGVFLSVTIFLLAGCVPVRGTIGAVLAQTADRRLVVREVPDGLAAGREGIQPDDEILLIDGRDARGMNAQQVHDALAGDVGQPVKLTLVRGDTVLRVTLRRTPAVRHRISGSTPAGVSE